MRTYRKADLERAALDWDDGEFNADEWPEWRALAADQGIIFPPRGSRWDSWEDDMPSQRAIIVRAIRNHPALLRQSIIGSRTWQDVVGKLIAGVGELRVEAAEEDHARSIQADELSSSRSEARHALEHIGNILPRTFPTEPK